MPVSMIENPAEAYGGEKFTNQVLGTYLSAETTTVIAKGDCVTIDTDGNILQSTTTVSELLAIGIAAEEIQPGGVGLVVERGVVKDAKAEGAITAPDLVVRSGATAGAVSATSDGGTTQPVLGEVIGVAIADAANDLVDLFVFKG